MIAVNKKLIPREILKDSVLVHLAQAYFSVGKRLEQRRNVRRRARSFSPRCAAAPHAIKIKSRNFLISTAP